MCLSVSVGHNREPYKTDEPIEMPFELWTRVGPMNRVLLGGGPILPGQGANLGVVLPLKCIRLCAQQTPRQHGAAAMFTIDVKKRSNKNKKTLKSVTKFFLKNVCKRNKNDTSP